MRRRYGQTCQGRKFDCRLGAICADSLLLGISRSQGKSVNAKPSTYREEHNFNCRQPCTATAEDSSGREHRQLIGTKEGLKIQGLCRVE